MDSREDLYEKIQKSVLVVTGGMVPTEDKLSSLRDKNSFWVSVARKINPELSWIPKLKNLALKYYKLCKYQQNGKDFQQFKSDLQKVLERSVDDDDRTTKETALNDAGAMHDDLTEKDSANAQCLQPVSTRTYSDVVAAPMGPEKYSAGQEMSQVCSRVVTFASGSFHQGNMEPTASPDSLGKQCTAICAVALAAKEVLPPDTWDATVLDTILKKGDELYVQSATPPFGYLEPLDLKTDLTFFDVKIHLHVDDGQQLTAGRVCGHIRWVPEDNNTIHSGSLTDGLATFFESNDSGLLVVDCYTFAVWRQNNLFWLFDSHAKDATGKYLVEGTSTCFSFRSTKDMADCIVQNFANDQTLYEVVSVCAGQSQNKADAPATLSWPETEAESCINSNVLPTRSTGQSAILPWVENEKVETCCADDQTDVRSPQSPPNRDSQTKSKRPLSNLKPATHTPRTKELGLQLKFEFTLPLSFWEDHFNPTKRSLSLRNKQNDKWTDVLAKEFKKGNSFCSLSFTNKVIRTPSKARSAALLTATVQCKMEGCYVFKLFLTKNTAKEILDVQVKTFGKFTHHGDRHRRPICGTERSELRTRTQHTKPNEIKIEKIYNKTVCDKKALDLGNFDNAPSQKCLQKISSEQNREGDLSADMWIDLELQKLRLEKEFRSEIFRELCKYPFKVMMMSDEQIRTYLSLRKPRIIYIDATGSEVCKLPWAKSDVHHYAMVINGGKDKAPVCLSEFLTEVKTTTKIREWLSTWQDIASTLNNGCFPVTQVVVIDYSWPLIHSTIGAFCNSNIIDYLKSVLEAKAVGKIDFTIIQLCIAHIIHAVAMHLSKIVNIGTFEGRTVRRTALHIFSSIQRTDDIEKAKWLFGHLAVIFDSRYISKSVAQSLKEITDFLQSSQDQHIDDILKKVDDSNEEEELELDVKTLWEQSPFTKIFMSVVVKKSDIVVNGTNEDNMFYLQNFVEYVLKRYMAYYPLWSCYTLRLVGINDENPPSTWPAESYFNACKNHMLRKELHQRPGRYVSILVPKVQQRLADFKHDVDFKKYKPRQKGSTVKSPDDIRNAVDKWKKGKQSRGTLKGRGAYSVLVANKKFQEGTSNRQFIDKIRKKYLTPKKNSCQTQIVRAIKEGDKSIDDPTAQPKCQMQEMKAETEEERLSAQPNIDIGALDGSPVLRDDAQSRQTDKRQRSSNCNQQVSPEPKRKIRKVLEFKTPTKQELLHTTPQESILEDRQQLNERPTTKAANHATPNPWEKISAWRKEIVIADSEFDMPSYDFGVDVRKSNMLCLLPTKWLNNYVVDRFAALQCTNASKHHAQIYAFTNDFLLKIEDQETTTSMYKEPIRCEFIKKDILLVPYCKQSHWSLYVILFKKKIVLHIDSLGLAPRRDVIPFLQSFINSEYRKTFKTNFDWSDWSYYTPRDIPNQNNSYDCGVHVCVWVYAICNGKRVNIDPAQSSLMRMWVMNEITDGVPRDFRTKKVDRRVELPKIKRLRNDVKWQTAVPDACSSTMEFCASLVGSLFQSKDGVCAMKKNCQDIHQTEFFCEIHKDFFHLKCIGDTPSNVNQSESYRCPECRSADPKKREQRRPKE